MLNALIIDDNREVAEELRRLLKLLGIEAAAAYGSRAGIVAMQASRPDLVFLDINMPGVTGFDVLAFIQREPGLAEIPVFIVSSEDQEDTIRKAIAEGAKAFLAKPVSAEELEAVLKQFVTL